MNIKGLAWFVLPTLLVAGLLGFPLRSSAADLQDQRHYVNDFAGKLSETTRKNLEVSLETYHRQHNVEIVIVIVEVPNEMKASDFRYARKLATVWGVGKKESDRGGCLLVVYSTGDQADLSVVRLITSDYEMDEAMGIFRPAIREALKEGDIPGITISGLSTLMNMFRMPNHLTVH